MNKICKAEGLEYIYNDNELFGIILRDEFSGNSVMFFTDDNSPQQLGFLPHKKGNIIRPHIHKRRQRRITITSEVLFVKSGKVKINFYDQSMNYVGNELLQRGDVILLCGGGHGFEIVEDTLMIEIKQGPYLGINDKEIFAGVEK